MNAAIAFEELAADRGVRFYWNRQPHRPMRNMDAFGTGCAVIDVDGDGWQDLLFIGQPSVGLFRNDGHGAFREITREANLEQAQGAWTGCAVGDYDGDGRLDLLLTGFHRLALLHNENGRTFHDTTRAAGLDPENGGRWGSSAGWMDLDGDGDLDLLVLNYVVTGPGVPEYCELKPGVKTGCPPASYQPQFAHLYENSGGRFRDRTSGSGMETTHGKALVVGFCDVNQDGRMDFYLGNDGTPADFMQNLGGLRFRNVAEENGAAFVNSRSIAGMGVDWADYDRDGKLDFAVSAFSDEAFPVFHNDGALFSDRSLELGVAEPTYKPLGFGTKFLDVDNDGWPDLLYATGHVYDRTNEIDPQTTLRQPLILFHNEQGKRFVDVVPTLGGALAHPFVGRGTATGDLDNDGRPDFLVADLEGPAAVFFNRGTRGAHWLTLDLRSRGSNRFAYGARVVAHAGDQVWVGQVSPASSYLSSSDPRVHFGLGGRDRLDRLTIRWPSGKSETVANPPADRILQLTEGRIAADCAAARTESAQSSPKRSSTSAAGAP